MLGKLLKYEWKASWKLMLSLDLFVLVIAVFAVLVLRLDAAEYSGAAAVTFTGRLALAAGYGVSMIAAGITTVIYLIWRFYTSVYGEQGYLLHTLPADKHQIILAKTGMSAMWILLSMSLIFGSLVMLMYDEDTVSGNIGRSVQYLLEMAAGAELTGGAELFMSVFVLVFAVTAKILKIMACLSLGQLSANHKLMLSFGIYFGWYLVKKTAGFCFLLVTRGWFWNRMNQSTIWQESSWELGLIANLLASVFFYLITWYVMDRKLNLE